jgi:hypothetical protein
MWLTGIALVQLFVIGVSAAILFPAPGVTVINFYKIEEGMPLEEVEALLGGPADLVGCESDLSLHSWADGPTRWISVGFDATGKACKKSLLRGQDTFWDRLRWRYRRK